MSQQGPLSFLSFCGVEIANAARVYEYLRAGLAVGAQGRFDVGGGSPCSVLYRENGGTCAHPDVYTSPAADPAPWWNPSDAASGRFLGLLITDITGSDSVIKRPSAPRTWGLGGAFLGQQQREQREWAFKGYMICADDVGADYGMRWLTGALSATACDECSTCDMRIRLACPPGDCSDDTVGEWLCYEAALTSGPKETKGDALVLGGCRELVPIEFTITCGDPYLYKRPQACLPPTLIGEVVECDDICTYLFGPAGDPLCCDVYPPSVGGTLGAIFTLTSESGMGPVLLEAYEECPGSAGSSVLPVLQIEVQSVPAGGTVVVDCSRHEITVTQPDENGDLVTSVADSLVVLPEGATFEWVEIRDCDRLYCVCARTAHPCSQGQDTYVSIQTQLRVD